MQTIPLTNLILIFIPLLLVWYMYKKWTGNQTLILHSTFRMVIQLLLIGYVLVYLFEQKSNLIGFFVLLFMLIVSTFITLRNSENNGLREYINIFISIFISGIIHLTLVLYFVLELESIYEPQYVIPIAGMIFASSMNTISLAIERFEKEVEKTFEQRRAISIKTAMIPQINTLFAIGLVTLPGMMTGQILSGVDPLIAVRYQIVIVAMIISSAGISLGVYFLLKQKFNK